MPKKFWFKGSDLAAVCLPTSTVRQTKIDSDFVYDLWTDWNTSGYVVTCIVVQKMNNNTSLFTFTNQNQNKQMREQTDKEQKGKFLYAYFTTDSLSAVTLCACSILSLESRLMVQDANTFQQKSKKVKYIADTIKNPIFSRQLLLVTQKEKSKPTPAQNVLSFLVQSISPVKPWPEQNISS